MSPRQLTDLADLFGTPVGTGEPDEGDLPSEFTQPAEPHTADAPPGPSPPQQSALPAPPGPAAPLRPRRIGPEPPVDPGRPDCVLGVRRGSGPKRRMTIGLPLTVAAELRAAQEQLRRHRSITDFVLAAVGALGDGGDPVGESDWAPGRYQTALFLAESEREELEARASGRAISVSALVAGAIPPYLARLQD